MNRNEESDPIVLAMKPTNKAGRPVAEPVERRVGTKGNESAQHAPGAEPGKCDPGAGSRTASSKDKEEGTVHRAPASCRHRSASYRVPRAPTRRRAGSGRPDVVGLRGRPRASARGPARPGPAGSVPTATVPPDVYTEGGREAAAAGDRRPGRQDRPGRDGYGAERDLRGRLPRVLLRVSTWTGTTRRAGCP
jgi:hypothetical protein